MANTNVSRTQTPTPYEIWMQDQGIPVVQGYGVTDLQQQPPAHWQSLGCSAVFVHLKGMEGITGMYAAEIPAGGETKTEKHLYEEVVYVLKGKGKTQLFGPGEGANSFDWQEGSLFAVPLNAPRKFVNTGTEPVLFLAVTTAPLVFDLFHNEKFVRSCDFEFTDRYSGEPNYFAKDAAVEKGLWQVNLVRDAPTALDRLRGSSAGDRPNEGAGTGHGKGYNIVQVEPSGNSLITHLADWPVGRYAKAHHHGGGAVLLILRSEGYTLMWPNELGTQPFAQGKGDRVIKVAWKVGSVFSPPTGWFHQHFNTGREPALQLAFRNGSRIYPFGVRRAATREGVFTPVDEGGTQIEYDKEDPEIRRMFEAALATRGLKTDMRP
jgi:mannose-6-phosphate isomerase-like protein (cupin superfamily)